MRASAATLRPFSGGGDAEMGAAAAEADRTLFVGNLETKVTEELLFELFHQVSGWDKPLLSFPGPPRVRPNGDPRFLGGSGILVRPGTLTGGRAGGGGHA